MQSSGVLSQTSGSEWSLKSPLSAAEIRQIRFSRTTFEVDSTSGVEHDSTGPLLVLDQGAVTALDSSNE
jgi:hypothetical protein